MSFDQTLAQIVQTKKRELQQTKESQLSYIEKIKTQMIYYCLLQLKRSLPVKEAIEKTLLKFCLH
jgi:hypothetical protein